MADNIATLMFYVFSLIFTLVLIGFLWAFLRIIKRNKHNDEDSKVKKTWKEFNIEFVMNFLNGFGGK